MHKGLLSVREGELNRREAAMLLDVSKQKAALQAAYQDLGQPESLARRVRFLACFADTAFLISRLGFYSFSVSTKYMI